MGFDCVHNHVFSCISFYICLEGTQPGVTSNRVDIKVNRGPVHQVSLNLVGEVTHCHQPSVARL